ncbi:MAG: hypothetical protein ACM37Z_16445 [Deltaproteobacteria bacterium]
MAMALIIIWLLASGLASNVVSEDNFQIQRSRVISTNLGAPDVAQNEKLPAVAVHPIGFEMVKSLRSSSVEATEVPARSHEEDYSYQLNCTFRL